MGMINGRVSERLFAEVERTIELPTGLTQGGRRTLCAASRSVCSNCKFGSIRVGLSLRM
jgi:hypothetical protein